MMAQFSFGSVRKWSLLDVIFWSIMVGCGETFVVAYALSKGLSEQYVGLLAILPQGVGSLIQLFSYQFLHWVGDRRKFVVLCAFLQAATLFMLAIPFDFSFIGIELYLMVVMSLYWGFGLCGGPAWNAWIVGLIPKNERTGFFATRGKFHEWALLVGLIFSGIALFISQEKHSGIFLLLFLVAGVARIVSAYCLKRHPSETDPVQFHRASDIKGFLNWIKIPKIHRHIIFLSLFHFGVAIGSPFFSPFLLKQMGLSYTVYTILICIPIVTRAISYKYHERMSLYLGPRKSLFINSAGIAVLPIAWVLSPNLFVFVCVQMIAGWVWAGFEYSTLIYQIQGFDAENRSRVLSWANLTLNFANVAGVLTGAALIGHAPNQQNYDSVFFLSFCLRMLPLTLVAWAVTKVAPKTIYKMFYRMVGVRPNRGPISKPIIYVDSEAKNHKKSHRRT